MCSGKIYYDLLDAREKAKNNQVVFIRIEQLYPFPAKTLANELKKYKKTQNFIGVRKNLKIWVLGTLQEIILSVHWILFNQKVIN